MENGSIVILNLQDPREKFIGKLLAISPSGITIKGVEVDSFSDWMSQFNRKQMTTIISPTTMFFPMHRVVNCYLDENIGDAPSFSSQFKVRTKKELKKIL